MSESDAVVSAPDGSQEGPVTPDRVRAALAGIVDPCSAATGPTLDVVAMGLVESIDISDSDAAGPGSHVDVAFRLTTPACHMVAFFVDETETRVGAVPGVDSVAVSTDDGTNWSEELLSAEARRRRQEGLDAAEARYRARQSE